MMEAVRLVNVKVWGALAGVGMAGGGMGRKMYAVGEAEPKFEAGCDVLGVEGTVVDVAARACLACCLL